MRKSSNLPVDTQSRLKQVKNFEQLFSLKSTVTFEINDSMALGFPNKFLKLNDSSFLWVDFKLPAYLYSITGKPIKRFNSYGRGPQELMSIGALSNSKSGKVYLYDNVLKRINVYNDRLDFIEYLILKHESFKKMVSDSLGNLYCLVENTLPKNEPAVVKYNKNGILEKEWGEIPPSAVVQDFLDGGGLAQDRTGNIYYGYMTDYRIFKSDSYGNNSRIFELKPGYFRENNDLFKSKSQRDLIINSWKVSRVKGIYYLDPGIIIQEIHTGDPRSGEKVNVTLEVFDLVGNKLITNIKLPKSINYVGSSEIGFIDEPNEVKNFLYQPKLSIYKLNL